jgi:hypothetical protein
MNAFLKEGVQIFLINFNTFEKHYIFVDFGGGT